MECSLEGQIYPANPVYRLSEADRPLLVRSHLDLFNCATGLKYPLPTPGP